MLRFAIALVLALAIVVLAAFFVRSALRIGGVEIGQKTDSGGQMPRIAFFLLLCVMAYAIATGAA